MQATDDLIQGLSEQAGSGGTAASLQRALLAALLLSLAAATLLVWVVFGFREDLAAVAMRAPFLFKAGGGLALAAGAYLLVRRATLPATGRLSLLLMFPGLLPFALFALDDPKNLGSLEAAFCSADISLLALPALWLILAAMKKGAPTSPARAGALAGLLAGSLATAAHALSCRNDQGMSVLIWYGAAILLLTGLGSLIGRRVLKW